MNALRLSAALLCCFALAVLVTAPAGAAEKATNKEKIVGTWEVTKAGSDLPEGSTIEFTKDGKLTINVKDKDKTITVQGTYTVDGDKVMVVTKFEDKEHKETITIKTLTDKKLVTVDEKKKEDEFKKK
jgi:uncharacterized protein (TIGR03066 family)